MSWLVALAGLLLAKALPAQEETPEGKGLRIAQEASARNDGFEDFTAGLTMVLRDKHGRESIRQMRFKVLEVPGDGDKSLFVFDEPRDVQGHRAPDPRPHQHSGRPVAVSSGSEAR